MDEWTDEKLAEVVAKKHAGNTDTDIICKNFLEALENNKYGNLTSLFLDNEER